MFSVGKYQSNRFPGGGAAPASLSAPAAAFEHESQATDTTYVDAVKAYRIL
jgi:hypothetical protein